MFSRIIPIPTDSESAYNRFWHLDLRKSPERAALESEEMILSIYRSAMAFVERRDRILWADPMITYGEWVDERLRRLRVRLAQRPGAAA